MRMKLVVNDWRLEDGRWKMDLISEVNTKEI